MTRFARARGSKASNEKLPEQATSWSEMKQQMLDKPMPSDSSQENRWKMSDFNEKKDSTVTSWAEFEINESSNNNTNRKKNNKKKRKNFGIETKVAGSELLALSKNSGVSTCKSKKKNKKLPEEKKESLLNPNLVSVTDNFKTKKQEKGSNTNNKINIPESNTGKQENGKQLKKKKIENNSVLHSQNFSNAKHSSIEYINGKQVKLMKYDGFPVLEEDFHRLVELKKKMISKGIPKDEVQTTIKLERRRAEKALSRERKKVCFNCRKAGHILSDCPELGKGLVESTIGTGICFKCGSTEHTHLKCRVVQGKDYKHATCFICKEQGHISSQCPDNRSGLYPKGGACYLCGEVSHLKKDCPQLSKTKQQSSTTLKTLTNQGVEELDEDLEKVVMPAVKKQKKAKKIKFQK